MPNKFPVGLLDALVRDAEPEHRLHFERLRAFLVDGDDLVIDRFVATMVFASRIVALMLGAAEQFIASVEIAAGENRSRPRRSRSRLR